MRTALPKPRAHTVPRPRLLRRLAGWREASLIQIVSPAGYGKTTLAALWLNELAAQPADIPPYTAWVSLSDDASADRLFTLCIDALAPHLPAVGDLRNVDGSAEFTAPSRVDVFCRALAASTTPVLLALDDVHLITDPAAHTLLQRILDAAPPPLHLLLLSRSIPPLQLGRLILNDAVIALTARDLTFDHEEFLAFTRTFGLDMQPAASLAALEQRSAGWVAGLKLLAHDLLHDRTPAHIPNAEADLDDFFSSRVLATLPTDLHRFCELAAPLPFLTTELTAAITQRPAAECDDRLRILAAANAFVTTFTSQDGERTFYRFHPLFHDFLRRRSARDPEKFAEAVHRAAVWLCTRDEVDAALGMLAEDDRRPTTDALADAIRRAVLRYDHAAVKRWLQKIPPAWLVTHAPLALAVGWHSLAVNPPNISDAAGPLQRAVDAVANLPPEPRFDELRAEAAVLQAFRCLILNDREELRRCIAAAERTPHAADGLATAYLHVLRAAFLDVDADIESRLQQIRTAADICERIGFSHGAIEMQNIQMVLQWRNCQFDAAQSSAAHMQATITQKSWRLSSYVPEIHFHRGEMYYLTDQLPAARTSLQLAVESGRDDGPTPTAFAYAAQILLQLCDTAESPHGALGYDLDADAGAWTRVLRNTSPLTHSTVAWPRLLRDFRAGRLGACRSTYESLQITPAQLNERLRDNQRFTVLAGAIFSGHHNAVISDKLAELRDFLAATHFHIMRLHVQALQALHAQQCGDVPAARRFLNELLPEIERTGMIRLLLDLPPLHPLFAACDGAFAHSLRARTPPSEATPPPPTTHDYDLTRRERYILQFLVADRDPKDIAAALSLSLGTVRGHILRIYRKLGVHSREEAVRVWRGSR